MATLPDQTSLGERPTPQSSGAVAQVQPLDRRSAMMPGQELQSAGNDLQQAGEILRQTNLKQDQITAMDAVNKLKQSALDLQLDPDKGFSNAKGNAVVDPSFVSGYKGQLSTAQQDIGQGLANENQRQIFNQNAQVIGLQFQSSLLQHQAKATIDFNRQTRSDTIDLGLKDIASHPYDDNTFNTNSLIMGKAIVDNGKEMGLEGDALANYVNAAKTSMDSKALMYRTEGMLQDNPMKAADFFHKHELEFDPQTRLQLGQQLKTTTDAQVSRISGASAYQSAIGTLTNNAPLPANMGADFVKPYDASRIDKIVQSVKAPSTYDALFDKYAQQYNVSAAELKLRATSESGMNPNAVSPAGATGLMQLMPDTAKRLGVTDAKDPEQSIAGAAKLMASSGGTLGGNMSNVDRAYYGGSTTAKGPNTDQYVENLRAVRTQLYGGQPANPTIDQLDAAQGTVIKNAKLAAEAYRPGDAVLSDQFVNEALKNLNQTRTTLQNNNNAAVSSVLGEIQNGAKAFGDLSPQAQKAYSTLQPETQMQLDKRFSQDIPKTEQTQQIRYAYQGMSQNQPEEFARSDLSSLASLLPHSDFDYLSGLQQQMNNRSNRDAEKQTNYVQAMSVAQKYVLDAVGLTTPNDKSTQEKKTAYNQFSGMFQTQLENWQAANGKPPAQADIINIARNLTAQVKIPGFFSDSKVPLYKLTPEQEAKAKVNVPADFKSNMASALQKRGITASDSDIQQAYLNSQLRPPKGGQ